MSAPELIKLDERYARMALRILVGPRDMAWHNTANQLFDEGPDYGWESDSFGQQKTPRDIFEVAGRILGYRAGLVEWNPEP